jgi:hypothetical protein
MAFISFGQLWAKAKELVRANRAKSDFFMDVQAAGARKCWRFDCCHGASQRVRRAIKPPRRARL